MVLGLCIGWPGASAAQAPRASGSASNTTLTPIVRNVTRVEMWRFFEPAAGGGDPDYAFLANRLLVGVKHSGNRHELNAALQYVQFAGLPESAIGPGALGTGANYFDHNRRTDSRQVYLKSLNLLLRNVVAGVSIRAGRMAYASGGETPSGDSQIEALKRLRLDSRIVGEFEWSIYQRAFDGGRADWDSRSAHVSVAALWPTQGGFDQRAGHSLRDVRVAAATAALKPSIVRHTELQGFAYDYRDSRPVSGRPDNSRRVVTGADIGFLTFGAQVAGVYPVRSGRADVLVWSALQRGDWYESDHNAWAIALEAGHQWTGARGAPWIRAGWNRASGDDDPSDLEHGTFVPPLPTSRKYAMSTAYTFMNLDDLFAQAIVKPSTRTTWRTDVHRLRLANGEDLWYAGSGATRRRGAIFGYAGRRSGGSDDLGTIAESAVDVSLTRHWSVNAYAGRMWGGAAVRSTFAGDRLTFAYVESVVQF
jgi:hypothetical protein